MFLIILAATTPSCPQGIIQWQHGTFSAPSNGSLILTPFGVDGRQLLSNPCQYQNSIYTRYNQSELFRVSVALPATLNHTRRRRYTELQPLQGYEVVTDSYSKALRLNLFAFDGAPLNPLYQAYKPPIMLPTQTLNPTTAGSTGGATATPSSTGKAKRSFFQGDADLGGPLNRNVLIKRKEPVNADKWWWIGAGMTAIGGVGYFCF